MPKCGTGQSCELCPLKPDDVDKYYGDGVNEIMGDVAMSLRHTTLPTDDYIADRLQAVGVGSSEFRIEQVRAAASRLGSAACFTR